ncbi:MAG: hypothetical protein ABSC56_13775 [Solirubrobacteraceae bacterium]
MALATIAAASIIAACGSNSPSAPDSSNSSGHSTQAQIQQYQRDAVRFVSCMRSHGANLPNPIVAPRAFKDALATPTPGLSSAEASCIHLMPGGGPHTQTTPYSPARATALLAFAHCLRSHGFQNFPDPNGSGQITHAMLAADGISLRQPGLLAAADTCTSVTHGLLTKAAVARFAAGQ